MLRQLVLDGSSAQLIERDPFYQGGPLEGMKHLPQVLGVQALPNKKRFGMKVGSARRRLPQELPGKVYYKTPAPGRRKKVGSDRLGSFEVMYGTPFDIDDTRYDEQIATGSFTCWTPGGFAFGALEGSSQEERNFVDRLGKALTGWRGVVHVHETHVIPFEGAAPRQLFTNFPYPSLLVFIGEEDSIPREVRDKSMEYDLAIVKRNASGLSKTMDEYVAAFEKAFPAYRIQKIWDEDFPSLFPDPENIRSAPLDTLYSGAFWVGSRDLAMEDDMAEGYPRSIEDIAQDLALFNQGKVRQVDPVRRQSDTSSAKKRGVAA